MTEKYDLAVVACLSVFGMLVFLATPAGAETQRLAHGPEGSGLVFIDWTSTSAGSGGGINATVAATINQGSMGFDITSATDPAFIALIDSTYPILLYQSGPGSGSGDISTALTFSSPFPPGSRLIALDVDFLGETLILTSDGMPLTLLSQIESLAGETSTFPTYDPLLGSLVSPNDQTSQTNEGDVSIFDVSGLLTLDIAFFNGGFNSGVGIAFALPGTHDADGDGIDGASDNCTKIANVDQRDTDADNIGNVCDPDVAVPNDCNVNFLDLNVYRANFFQPGDFDTDNNGDGQTNFLDLNIVRSFFFGPPGPSANGCH